MQTVAATQEEMPASLAPPSSDPPAHSAPEQPTPALQSTPPEPATPALPPSEGDDQAGGGTAQLAPSARTFLKPALKSGVDSEMASAATALASGLGAVDVPSSSASSTPRAGAARGKSAAKRVVAAFADEGRERAAGSVRTAQGDGRRRVRERARESWPVPPTGWGREAGRTMVGRGVGGEGVPRVVDGVRGGKLHVRSVAHYGCVHPGSHKKETRKNI